jgi:hypothetical protein
LPWCMPTSSGSFMIARASNASVVCRSFGRAEEFDCRRPPLDAEEVFYRRSAVADYRSLSPEDGFVNADWDIAVPSEFARIRRGVRTGSEDGLYAPGQLPRHASRPATMMGGSKASRTKNAR